MTRRSPCNPDRDAAASRSQRWRAAAAIEDRLAVVETTIARDGAAPALRREAARLRNEHARLVALEGLCWPLRPDAHATVLAAMQAASDALARDGEATHPRAPRTESNFPRPNSTPRQRST